MMKRLLTTVLLAWTGILLSAAPVERVYVSTDRPVYLAGDAVWCSLSILDRNGRFSNESAVAYLELVSTDGTACTAKIGLLEGRGAGSFRIPVTTPTGTYRLVAYTAVNAAEEGTPWMAGSRILTVFNTTSAARVAGGVELVDEADYEKQETAGTAPEGALELSMRVRLPKNAPAVLNLHNAGSAASVSLSVYHEDDLAAAPQENTPGSFLEAIPDTARLSREASPEKDGEVITARLRGTLIHGPDDLSFATLSSAGSPSDVYIGRTDGDDRIRFYTSNIYGNREIVCEVSQLDRKEGYIDFESPFLRPDAGKLPRLRLSPAQRTDLMARKTALRREKTLRTDTLTSFMAHREDLLLASVAPRRYHLDEYTRFPSVREIIVEIIPELTLRSVGGEPMLFLTYGDALGRRFDRTNNILVMMDGVVLSDLGLLLDFDAMLLEDIDIYNQAVIVGKTPVNGIVNFITKKNYVTALRFPANVRVVDFQGVAYPVAYHGAVPAGEGQDLRELLYWDPVLKMEQGSDRRLEIHTPGYSGRFKAVAEGFTEDGKPVYQELVFEVE
ncbi:MAG: hypothetical protein IJP73_07090 [Bacteroidales bacterium]|nr:hypothetical protein [Bacteroidales bacterium]